MGEFWQDGCWTEHGQNKNGKQTSTAAHLYGKRIAAAEAFTRNRDPHWMESPALMKPVADKAFCDGFNWLFLGPRPRTRHGHARRRDRGRRPFQPQGHLVAAGPTR